MYKYATIVQSLHHLLIVHQIKHFTAIWTLGGSAPPLAPDKLHPCVQDSVRLLHCTPAPCRQHVWFRIGCDDSMQTNSRYFNL